MSTELVEKCLLEMEELLGFNFNKMFELSKNDIEEFEKERKRILKRHFDSLPEDMRSICLKVQSRIDLVRNLNDDPWDSIIKIFRS